jgi:hypothetical protein
MKPIATWILLFCLTLLRLEANVLVTGINTSGTGTGNAYGADASNSDLVNTGSASLASTTLSTPVTGSFSSTAHNNGAVGDPSTTADITFWLNAQVGNTYSITYTLDTSVNTLGYVINSIQTLHGWTNSSGTQKNQTYEVFVSTVGSPAFTPLATVAYAPFPTSSNTASTKVNITEVVTGILASGIDEIRFTYTVATGGSQPSPTIREIDVFGSPIFVVPSFAVTSPVSRQVVQRSGSNLGVIPVAGTAQADRVEARAVASGATNTPWQTIATQPNGAFSGTLTGIPAGGWYSVEVRTITAEISIETAIINKVGVGDIYVTAGQSNSANHGGPAATPADDRVVARSSVSGNSWVATTDPMPIASGTGGSTWSRLGDLLAAAENVPIGFIAIGVGSTQVSQWIPGTSNYNNRLKPALQSLPLNGFRAVLWHQGESDSIAGVSAATHASRLNSMISQSRIDAGWNVPWYLAEASFHPNTSLVAEERIAAGQRSVVDTDPLTFLGPSTDEFHLEDAAGGKLVDSVHFNAAGLLDHATQWRDILLETTVITPRNSGFEDNRAPAITGLAALADGASHLVTISGANDSPMVLDWRILAASGVEAADGNNGFHNPGTGTYSEAVDTANGGVLPNMEGPHVAVLDGGSTGNYFLQTTRVAAKANTIHTLTVALGVRDNPATFGNARLVITSNGLVVASSSFNKPALDALRGGDSSGTFTNASVAWTIGDTVAAHSLVAIRIVKEGGAGTVLDFDKVRLTALPNTFSSWIDGFDLDPADKDFIDDPDSDGLANGIEAQLGTNPSQFNAGLANLSSNGTTTIFTHPQNDNPPVDAGGIHYGWSEDLVNWHPSGSGPTGGATVTFAPVTIGMTTTVTATASAALEKFFLRIRATGH